MRFTFLLTRIRDSSRKFLWKEKESRGKDGKIYVRQDGAFLGVNVIACLI